MPMSRIPTITALRHCAEVGGCQRPRTRVKASKAPPATMNRMAAAT